MVFSSGNVWVKNVLLLLLLMYLFNFTYQRDCRIVSRTPFVKRSMFWKVIFSPSLPPLRETNKQKDMTEIHYCWYCWFKILSFELKELRTLPNTTNLDTYLSGSITDWLFVPSFTSISCMTSSVNMLLSYKEYFSSRPLWLS